jgi:hypothetical protein
MFGVLPPLSVPEKPWDDITMDFMVGLPECEQFDAVWVVVDRLSKMRQFIACQTTIDALGLAVVSWRSCTPQWLAKEYCLCSRASFCVNLLRTDMQRIGN